MLGIFSTVVDKSVDNSPHLAANPRTGTVCGPSLAHANRPDKVVLGVTWPFAPPKGYPHSHRSFHPFGSISRRPAAVPGLSAKGALKCAT